MKPRGGFTIIELMIVIAILGIGAAMSVSSLITVMPRWNLQGSASAVLTQLQFARFEAVRRNRPVVVTFTNKGNTSTSTMGIFVDSNRNGVLDGGEPVLRTLVIPTLHPRNYISTVADGGGTAISSITFGADGMVRNPPKPTPELTMPITITMASTVATATSNYQVVIARSGIAKSAP